MSEPDDQLENFIRKGLGKSPYSFREEDWALMEAKLDAMPVAPSLWHRLRWWGLVVLLFFISFFSGWALKGYFEGVRKNSQQSEHVESAQTPLSESVKTEESKDLSNKNGGEKQEKGADKSFTETERNIKSVTDNPSTETKREVSTDTQRENEEVEKSSPITILSVPEEELTPTKRQQVIEPREAISVNEGDFITIAPMTWHLEWLALPNHRAIHPWDRPTVAVHDTTYEEPQKNKKPYHLSIGLLVSPDFTGTSLGNSFESVGNSYGMGLEYYVSHKTRLKMAVLLNQKVYSATGDEYTIPRTQYGSSATPSPDWVDAVCDILEIPLYIQFRVLDSERHGLWLSTGLSSYWMRREKYQYTYADYVTPGADGILIEKENRHLLSVLNLGLAYERQLSPSLSIELEPYIKIPLGGVGYGKVSLYTTGAYLSFKYHIKR